MKRRELSEQAKRARGALAFGAVLLGMFVTAPLRLSLGGQIAQIACAMLWGISAVSVQPAPKVARWLSLFALIGLALAWSLLAGPRALLALPLAILWAAAVRPL